MKNNKLQGITGIKIGDIVTLINGNGSYFVLKKLTIEYPNNRTEILYSCRDSNGIIREYYDFEIKETALSDYPD